MGYVASIVQFPHGSVFFVVILAHFCHNTKCMNELFEPAGSKRFEAALRRFDEENARDPSLESTGARPQPRELAYACWLSDWVLRLSPDASEPLRLAARSAHLCRWTIPRESHPMTRAGYLRWRQELKTFHARKAGEILRELQYSEEIIQRVQSLISKSALPADLEAQVLEDALCLVFLEHQFAPLARKSSDEKMINALQKTWKKMSPRAREIAKTLSYGAAEKTLLDRALD
jgi:hypothetical protein